MSGPRKVPMGTKQKYTPSDPGQKGGEGFSGGSNAFPGKDPAEDHQYGHGKEALLISAVRTNNLQTETNHHSRNRSVGPTHQKEWYAASEACHWKGEKLGLSPVAEAETGKHDSLIPDG